MVPTEGDLRKVRWWGSSLDEGTLSERLVSILRGVRVEDDGAVEEPSRALLRAALISAARKSLKGSLSPDAEIIWAVRGLTKLDNQVNELDELVAGWARARDLSTVDDAQARIEGIDALRSLAAQSRTTIEEEERYLEERMRTLAPTVTEVCGSKLGAQIIELAGGLRQLAMKPSSTVQVLGAEKAMFRHLRAEAAPPKHGVIFQHPTVQFAAKKDRGKAARHLAAQISRAARKDAFGVH